MSITQENQLEPDRLIEYECDLIWVRPNGAPILWSYLDWNLQGQIQRAVEQASNKMFYIPTFGKTAAPWIALDKAESFSQENFGKSCAGLKAKKVLILCSPDEAKGIEKHCQKFENQKHDDSPETIRIALDPVMDNQ